MGTGGQGVEGRVVSVCRGKHTLGLLCVGEEERGYWVVSEDEAWCGGSCV